MKILFDYQIFDCQNFGGISRSFVELITHLPTNIEKEIGVFETDNVYLNNIGYLKCGDYYHNFIKKGEFPAKRRLFDIYNKIRHYQYWNISNKQRSINLVKQGNYDIFHPTFFDHYFLDYLQEKPFVLTIHDMIPELYPQYFDAKNDFQINMKRKLAPLASAIIAVSNSTKQDIVNILNIPEEKIHVIYHGCKKTSITYTNNNITNGPYILYVGERGAYKNFIPWIKYVRIILEKYKEIKVLCTGKPFSKEECEYLTNYGIMDRFVQYFANTDEELQNLYRNAICFVYTSEYEGFGIPILEAYQAQCPVLLNNASCFPEIAGDAAIYFHLNQNGDSDFAEVFENFYLKSSNDKKILLENQNKRLEMYSWEKAAKQLTEVYQNIL